MRKVLTPVIYESPITVNGELATLDPIAKPSLLTIVCAVRLDTITAVGYVIR